MWLTSADRIEVWLPRRRLKDKVRPEASPWKSLGGGSFRLIRATRGRRDASRVACIAAVHRERAAANGGGGAW